MTDPDDLMDNLDDDDLDSYYRDRRSAYIPSSRNSELRIKEDDSDKDLLNQILEEYDDKNETSEQSKKQDQNTKKATPLNPLSKDSTTASALARRNTARKTVGPLDSRASLTTKKSSLGEKMKIFTDVEKNNFFSKPRAENKERSESITMNSAIITQIVNDSTKKAPLVTETTSQILKTEPTPSQTQHIIEESKTSSLESSQTIPEPEKKLQINTVSFWEDGLNKPRGASVLNDPGIIPVRTESVMEPEKTVTEAQISKPEAPKTRIEEAEKHIEKLMAEKKIAFEALNKPSDNKRDLPTLEVLMNKPTSRLLQKKTNNMFVPGKQNIIRGKPKGDEYSPKIKIDSMVTSKVSKPSTKSFLRDSTLEIAKDPIYEFEKEDYENTRPLKIDEFITNFMVSENPYYTDYVVPLTSSMPLYEISRPFYLELEGGSWAGKPRSVIRISSNLIAFGTSLGQIHLFQLPSNQCLAKLGSQKEASFGAVTSMDHIANSKFFVSGTEKGAVLVWDMASKTLVKTANTHEGVVVMIKIIKPDPLLFITGDSNGQMVLHYLEKLMLFYNLESQIMFSPAAGFNFVDLRVMNEYCPSFNKIGPNGENELVIAISSIQQLIFITLEPNSRAVKKLLLYPRPPLIFDSGVPYICWYEYKLKDVSDPEYWLFIGWGFCVFLVRLINNNGTILLKEEGYIKIGADVMHVGLISDELLVVIDVSGFLHLVHVEDFKKTSIFFLPDGTYNKNKNEQISIYSEKLDMGEGNDMVSLELHGKNTSYGSLKVYSNIIVSSRDSRDVILIYPVNIYRIKLNEYRDILDMIEEEKDYLKLLTVGLALYNQTIKEIASLDPEEDHKKILRQCFNDKLRRFVTTVLMSKTINTKDHKDLMLVEEVGLTLIDFCLETEMETFLFTDGINVMTTLGFREIFLKSLEPFIRLNKIHYIPTFDCIKEVISFYYKIGKPNITEQLLANFYLHKWSIEDQGELILQLMTRCLETDLYTALTYLCIKATDNATLPFMRFHQKSLESDMRGNYQAKKKYILRCLWYLKIVFKRRLFFEQESIQDEKMKKILRDLIVLLMEDSIIKLFYQIEPGLTTVLISMLFNDPLSSLVEELYGSVNLAKVSVADSRFEKNLHFQILNKIHDLFEKSDFQDREKKTFLAFLTSKVIENPVHKFLSEEVALQLAKYLLKNHQELDNLIILDFRTNFVPVQNEYGDLVDPEEEIRAHINQDILTERKGVMIERLIIYAENLLKKMDVISELIGICGSTFAEPVCFLYAKRGDYKECLDKYLSKISPKQTQRKAITWANNILSQKKIDDPKAYAEIQQLVYDRIESLIGVDPEGTKHLINNHFKGREREIMSKLEKSPEIQLEFIEKLIQTSRNPDVFDDNMIALHIKLLCESKSKAKRKRVLYELKEYERYPSACLNICKQYLVKDAWAYLEEIVGTPESILKALDLRFEVFRDYFLKTIQKVKQEPSAKQVQKFKDKLRTIIDTLTSHFSTSVNLQWFRILEKLLEIEPSISSIENYDKKKTFKDAFESLVERAYLDAAIRAIDFETIIQELTARSDKVSPELVKKFLVRILNDNFFEYRVREDASKLMEQDYYQLLNYDLLPFEKQGAYHENICSNCKEYIHSGPTINFNCGHLFHFRQNCMQSKEASCPVCTRNVSQIPAKFSYVKQRKPGVLPDFQVNREVEDEDGLDEMRVSQVTKDKKKKYLSKLQTLDSLDEKIRRENEAIQGRYVFQSRY